MVAEEPVPAEEPVTAKPQGMRPCPSCGEQCLTDANFCEACGVDLDAAETVPKQPCVSCNADAVEVTDDGWCQICGTKQPAPEDHVVADHGWFAVVSDRGRVHRTNEDAGAVAARPAGVALVVCDGVSSTDESQHAARAAVKTIVERLESASSSTIGDAIVKAASLARDAIVEVTPTESNEPPSCTMVTAIAEVADDEATIELGWLGDSRAYWLSDTEAQQLTRDHSWAIEQTELGELDQATIDADPRAHSITRWLGADSHDVTPERLTLKVSLSGTLLLCSDGLWNYAPTEADMFALVNDGPDDESPRERAERLVAFANEKGGHDNITVAIAELSPTANLIQE